MWSRLILLAVGSSAVEAQANTIWPFAAYYMEQEFLDNYRTIGIGLIIEFAVVWKVFAVSPLKAAGVNVVMNVASTVMGLLMIYGLAMVGFDVFGDFIAYRFMEPVQVLGVLAANVLFLSLLNALIEGAVLRWAFRCALNARRFTCLLLANFLSVGVSLAGLWIHTGGEPWVNPRAIV